MDGQTGIGTDAGYARNIVNVIAGPVAAGSATTKGKDHAGN